MRRSSSSLKKFSSCVRLASSMYGRAGVRQGIQRARLACVGASCERHFKAVVVRALVDFGCAEHEGCLLAQAEDGILELHVISGESGACKGCGKRCRFRFSGASI